MSNETNNTTVKLLENVIIFEVDNILQGWPTYVINFTPQDTSPHKIILHLKNPSKCVTMDSDDEDRDPGAPPSEYRKLTTNIDARVFVPKPRYNGSKPLIENTDENAKDAESSDDAKETSSDDEKTPVNTIPVNLCGIPKDTIPTKRKTFDPNWPPRRPRAFRHISQNSSIANYEAFMTFPAAVKREEGTCGGPDNKINEGECTVKN
ncbi:hypothetical protein PISMIDRAFT_16792 [Pisolithus microcarpus 441]|uniref:Uncharacterized protein n=1 Tax=Pisolithus microcarpus 441 TaxID=765257 RepID=A0A0C9YES2_9AGAM|nr:hypothetical protein PISMIDRAFT_16792 [Pisolithus microcarpus 441]